MTSWVARQPYRELAELTDLAIDHDATAVLLRHDVVAHRVAKPGTLARRLGGEEWSEQLVFDFFRDADAIVTHFDLRRVAQLPCDDRECGLETRRRPHASAPTRRIEAVAE